MTVDGRGGMWSLKEICSSRHSMWCETQIVLIIGSLMMTANCFDDFVVVQYNSFRIQFESSFKSTEYYEFPLRKSYETFFPFSQLKLSFYWFSVYVLSTEEVGCWEVKSGSKGRKTQWRGRRRKKSYGNILLSSVFFPIHNAKSVGFDDENIFVCCHRAIIDIAKIINP